MAIIINPSTVTCSNTTIGSAATITINKSKPGFVHTLQYTFKSFSGTIVEKTTVYNYSWTVPIEFYNELTSSSGVATIHCLTYDGSMLIGTTHCDFTVSANPYDTPTINPTIIDTNSTTIALTGDSSKLVRYRSTAYVTINAAAKNGATIASQKAFNANQYFTTPTGSFGNVESNHFTFEAVDSRGIRTVGVGRDLAAAGRWIEYSLPSCSIESSKPDTSGNMRVECSGVWWNKNFGAAANTLTIQYRYKIDGGTYSGWTAMNTSITAGSNNYTAYATISGLEYRNTYIFQTRAVDKLSTTESAEYSARALPVFSWGSGDFEFNVPVHFAAGATGIVGAESEAGSVDGDFIVKGDLRLKRDASNFGCTLRFGDSDYAYITETTDDDLTIKASDLNLNANVKVNSKTIDAGSWTPSLNNSAVSRYNSRSGWYLRIGNYVTIGWNIKAAISSGYQTTSISISGAPFVETLASIPYPGAGGGVCSGAYVSAGFNFQGYVIETDGKITTRVQACNNTSAANLSTSASGCFYPNGGGELTLIGSLTYAAKDTFK